MSSVHIPIVVNIGTNDASYIRNSGNAISKEEFMTSALDLISKLRSKNATAPILWIGGIMGKYDDNLINALREISAQDSSVTYTDAFVQVGSGGNYHPNVAEHRLTAQTLVSIIKGSYGYVFE